PLHPPTHPHTPIHPPIHAHTLALVHFRLPGDGHAWASRRPADHSPALLFPHHAGPVAQACERESETSLRP
ncbi:hypothetical protein COCMIDRAFT_104147, partial [Bipolaris oryzae ATCC 44560]